MAEHPTPPHRDLPDAGPLLNALMTCILVLDDDLVIRYANPAAQQLLAQSPRKLFGTPLPDLLSYLSWISR